MTRDADQWKRVMRRQADALEARSGQSKWGPAASVRLETVVLLGMHAMRKLIDADLLPPAYAKQKITVTEYPYIKTGLGTHWRDFQNHYDFSRGKRKTHTPLFLAHQMTDNGIFAPQSDSKGLQGVFMTSNHQLHKALYEVPLPDLVRLFRRADS